MPCMSLDPEGIRSILKAQFPSLRADRIAWLGEGYDSVAFAVDDAWVFRFPKREDVEQQLLRELRVLPAIAARSPIAIPEYRFVGSPSASYPRHFGGYPMLPGVPAHQLTLGSSQLAQIAPQIGRFLSVLHAQDPSGVRADLPLCSSREVLQEMQAEALNELHNLEVVSTAGLATRWRAFLEQAPPPDSMSESAVVVHGDLAAEHVLVDPESGKVTGVIDWSEIGLSSAALDLAALYHWGGKSFAANALEYYEHGVTSALLQQARFIAACRAVLDVTFGLETGRAEYIAGALRTLNAPANGDAF